MSLALIALIVSIAYFFRIGLILIGALKGPILQTFEKYGDQETIYYPLPSILLWSGVFMVSASAIIGDTIGVSFQIAIFAILIFLAAYFAYANPELARQYPQIFMSYPRWYYDLRDRTTRQERRRLAYMWLWLPRRLRLVYNGSDHAFNQWADLVIISSTRYEASPETWREDKYYPRLEY
jgi:hypothetical protein